MKIFSKQLPASIKKLVIPSIGVLALVIFSSVAIYEATKVTVEVMSDGEEQTVKTHANTAGELLEELGIEVGEHDDISPSLDTNLENNMNIYHKKSKQLYLVIDEEEESYYTTEDTVGEFLRTKDLSFSKHDVVNFDEADEIVDGLTLAVTTAYLITINDGDKEELKVWTTERTVGALLEEKEIELDKDLDQIKPNLKTKLDHNSTIEITRINKKTDTAEEAIKFKTEEREDDSLEKGTTKVVQEGKNGKINRTYEITEENGKEIARDLIEEEIIDEVKNKIVAIGTKEPQQQNLVTLSKETKKGSSNEKEVLYVTATAYSADACSGCSGVTATGINLKANPHMKVISVDPNVIPLGTKVWVEGYGNAVAGDTGGAIKGNKIDIHLPSHSEALRYGRKHNVKVVIIE